MDIIGLVFPVYFQNLPKIAGEFIEKFNFEKHQYVFSIITHNEYPGNTLFSLKQLLMRKGILLAAGFQILMPGNMIALVDASTNGEEQKRRIADAGTRVKEIAAAIRDRIRNMDEVTYSFKDAVRGKRNYWILRQLYPGHKKFHTTPECSGCGICEKICPRKCFTLSEGIIMMNGYCEYCLACLHWCPGQALQNGRGTLKRPRYHHPDISINEMLEAVYK